MIRIKEECYPRIIIDLDGPDGNVFHLLARMHEWGRQLGAHCTEAIVVEMRKKDYTHAVAVFVYAVKNLFYLNVTLETKREEFKSEIEDYYAREKDVIAEAISIERTRLVRKKLIGE